MHTSFRNHKNPTATLKTMPLTEGSFDAVALFFNLRCEDAAKFRPGEKHTLEMVLEDTIRRINYRLAGREVRNIKGVGKFRTLKFVCELPTSSGESFKDGSEFYLWISDDLNKIPLYLESPIRIGSVRVRLLDASNLKYPLTSKNQIGGSAGRYGLPCNGNGPSFPARQRAVCREAAPGTKSAPANGTARQKCTDFAGSGPGHPDERQKRDEPKRNNGTGTGKVTQNRRKRQQFNRILLSLHHNLP